MDSLFTTISKLTAAERGRFVDYVVDTLRLLATFDPDHADLYTGIIESVELYYEIEQEVVRTSANKSSISALNADRMLDYALRTFQYLISLMSDAAQNTPVLTIKIQQARAFTAGQVNERYPGQADVAFSVERRNSLRLAVSRLGQTTPQIQQRLTLLRSPVQDILRDFRSLPRNQLQVTDGDFVSTNQILPMEEMRQRVLNLQAQQQKLKQRLKELLKSDPRAMETPEGQEIVQQMASIRQRLQYANQTLASQTPAPNVNPNNIGFDFRAQKRAAQIKHEEMLKRVKAKDEKTEQDQRLIEYLEAERDAKLKHEAWWADAMEWQQKNNKFQPERFGNPEIEPEGEAVEFRPNQDSLISSDGTHIVRMGQRFTDTETDVQVVSGSASQGGVRLSDAQTVSENMALSDDTLINVRSVQSDEAQQFRQQVRDKNAQNQEQSSFIKKLAEEGKHLRSGLSQNMDEADVEDNQNDSQSEQDGNQQKQDPIMREEAEIQLGLIERINRVGFEVEGQLGGKPVIIDEDNIGQLTGHMLGARLLDILEFTMFLDEEGQFQNGQVIIHQDQQTVILLLHNLYINAAAFQNVELVAFQAAYELDFEFEGQTHNIQARTLQEIMNELQILAQQSSDGQPDQESSALSQYASVDLRIDDPVSSSQQRVEDPFDALSSIRLQGQNPRINLISGGTVPQSISEGFEMFASGILSGNESFQIPGSVNVQRQRPGDIPGSEPSEPDSSQQQSSREEQNSSVSAQPSGDPNQSQSDARQGNIPIVAPDSSAQVQQNQMVVDGQDAVDASDDEQERIQIDQTVEDFGVPQLKQGLDLAMGMLNYIQNLRPADRDALRYTVRDVETDLWALIRYARVLLSREDIHDFETNIEQRIARIKSEDLNREATIKPYSIFKFRRGKFFKALKARKREEERLRNANQDRRPQISPLDQAPIDQGSDDDFDSAQDTPNQTFQSAQDTPNQTFQSADMGSSNFSFASAQSVAQPGQQPAAQQQQQLIPPVAVRAHANVGGFPLGPQRNNQARAPVQQVAVGNAGGPNGPPPPGWAVGLFIRGRGFIGGWLWYLLKQFFKALAALGTMGSILYGVCFGYVKFGYRPPEAAKNINLLIEQAKSIMDEATVKEFNKLSSGDQVYFAEQYLEQLITKDEHNQKILKPDQIKNIIKEKKLAGSDLIQEEADFKQTMIDMNRLLQPKILFETFKSGNETKPNVFSDKMEEGKYSDKIKEITDNVVGFTRDIASKYVDYNVNFVGKQAQQEFYQAQYQVEAFRDYMIEMRDYAKMVGFDLLEYNTVTQGPNGEKKNRLIEGSHLHSIFGDQNLQEHFLRQSAASYVDVLNDKQKDAGIEFDEIQRIHQFTNISDRHMLDLLLISLLHPLADQEMIQKMINQTVFDTDEEGKYFKNNVTSEVKLWERGESFAPFSSDIIQNFAKGNSTSKTIDSRIQSAREIKSLESSTGVPLQVLLRVGMQAIKKPSPHQITKDFTEAIHNIQDFTRLGDNSVVQIYDEFNGELQPVKMYVAETAKGIMQSRVVRVPLQAMYDIVKYVHHKATKTDVPFVGEQWGQQFDEVKRNGVQWNLINQFGLSQVPDVTLEKTNNRVYFNTAFAQDVIQASNGFSLSKSEVMDSLLKVKNGEPLYETDKVVLGRYMKLLRVENAKHLDTTIQKINTTNSLDTFDDSFDDLSSMLNQYDFTKSVLDGSVTDMNDIFTDTQRFRIENGKLQHSEIKMELDENDKFKLTERETLSFDTNSANTRATLQKAKRINNQFDILKQFEGYRTQAKIAILYNTVEEYGEDLKKGIDDQIPDRYEVLFRKQQKATSAQKREIQQIDGVFNALLGMGVKSANRMIERIKNHEKVVDTFIIQDKVDTLGLRQYNTQREELDIKKTKLSAGQAFVLEQIAFNDDMFTDTLVSQIENKQFGEIQDFDEFVSKSFKNGYKNLSKIGEKIQNFDKYGDVNFAKAENLKREYQYLMTSDTISDYQSRISPLLIQEIYNEEKKKEPNREQLSKNQKRINELTPMVEANQKTVDDFLQKYPISFNLVRNTLLKDGKISQIEIIEHETLRDQTKNDKIELENLKAFAVSQVEEVKSTNKHYLDLANKLRIFTGSFLKQQLNTVDTKDGTIKPIQRISPDIKTFFSLPDKVTQEQQYLVDKMSVLTQGIYQMSPEEWIDHTERVFKTNMLTYNGMWPEMPPDAKMNVKFVDYLLETVSPQTLTKLYQKIEPVHHATHGFSTLVALMQDTPIPDDYTGLQNLEQKLLTSENSDMFKVKKSFLSLAGDEPNELYTSLKKIQEVENSNPILHLKSLPNVKPDVEYEPFVQQLHEYITEIKAIPPLKKQAMSQFARHELLDPQKIRQFHLKYFSSYTIPEFIKKYSDDATIVDQVLESSRDYPATIFETTVQKRQNIFHDFARPLNLENAFKYVGRGVLTKLQDNEQQKKIRDLMISNMVAIPRGNDRLKSFKVREQLQPETQNQQGPPQRTETQTQQEEPDRQEPDRQDPVIQETSQKVQFVETFGFSIPDSVKTPDEPDVQQSHTRTYKIPDAKVSTQDDVKTEWNTQKKTSDRQAANQQTSKHMRSSHFSELVKRTGLENEYANINQYAEAIKLNHVNLAHEQGEQGIAAAICEYFASSFAYPESFVTDQVISFTDIKDPRVITAENLKSILNLISVQGYTQQCMAAIVSQQAQSNILMQEMQLDEFDSTNLIRSEKEREQVKLHTSENLAQLQYILNHRYITKKILPILNGLESSVTSKDLTNISGPLFSQFYQAASYLTMMDLDITPQNIMSGLSEQYKGVASASIQKSIEKDSQAVQRYVNSMSKQAMSAQKLMDALSDVTVAKAFEDRRKQFYQEFGLTGTVEELMIDNLTAINNDVIKKDLTDVQRRNQNNQNVSNFISTLGQVVGRDDENAGHKQYVERVRPIQGAILSAYAGLETIWNGGSVTSTFNDSSLSLAKYGPAKMFASMMIDQQDKIKSIPLYQEHASILDTDLRQNLANQMQQLQLPLDELRRESGKTFTESDKHFQLVGRQMGLSVHKPEDAQEVKKRFYNIIDQMRHHEYLKISGNQNASKESVANQAIKKTDLTKAVYNLNKGNTMYTAINKHRQKGINVHVGQTTNTHARTSVIKSFPHLFASKKSAKGGANRKGVLGKFSFSDRFERSRLVVKAPVNAFSQNPVLGNALQTENESHKFKNKSFLKKQKRKKMKNHFETGQPGLPQHTQNKKNVQVLLQLVSKMNNINL